MRLFLASVLLLAGVAGAQLTPPPAAQTPSGVTYALAVHRGWEEQATPFCDGRAYDNARAAYPAVKQARFKFVRTFGFTSSTSPRNEQSMLGYTNSDLDSTFPWRVGQWMSRQYSSALTPNYLYLLELQEVPGKYNSTSNVCLTVFALR